MIAECTLYVDCPTPNRLPGSLRLTHSRLAFLPNLLKGMFSTLTFQPHPEKQSFDWFNVKKYVRNIIFQPTLVTPAPYGCEHAGHPVSGENLRHGELRKYVYSGQAHGFFAAAMKQLPNLRGFTLNCQNPEQHPEKPMVPNNPGLYDFVARCVSLAELRPEELCFQNFQTDYPYRQYPESWKTLDLSCLRKITCMPANAVCIHDDDDRACDCGLFETLAKCASCLQELTLDWTAVIVCERPKRYPSMAALSSMSLRECCIGVGTFADWIRDCPNLEKISLSDVYPELEWVGDADIDGGSLKVWFRMFDSIRNHPNRMMIDIKRTSGEERLVRSAQYVNTAREIASFRDLSFRHHTSKPASDWSDEDRPEGHSIPAEWKCAITMIKNYMSGFGEWSLDELGVD